MGKTDTLLTRRVEKILPAQEGLSQLLSERKIKVYLGVDPTGSRLHIGHAIGLKKLAEFAAAGHEVTFLFGTGTVLVGDPSLRDSARTTVTQAEIDANIKNWQTQAAKIVDFSKVTVKQNGEWLTKLTLKDLVGIAAQISAVQLFKRDSFQRRLDKGDTVWYHETLYPLLQGYDSVVLDVDLEIGGSDQEFNMLIGRELQKKMNNREKYVLTTPMILGTDGQQMSKTSNNCVWLDDSAEEMYGKLMSIPDGQILSYLELCTDVDQTEVDRVKLALEKGENPRDHKDFMAQAIIAIYHSAEAAKSAAQNFTSQFSKGELPADIPSVKLAANKLPAEELLVQAKLVDSKSEAKRLLEQGGVKLNGQVINLGEIEVKSGDVIQVGKRRFARVA